MRGRLSKPNETQKNMGISTIPMSAFFRRANKGAALFLYLGLGLASSYIDPEKIGIGCSAD